MSPACTTPIAWEHLVDYWAGDVDPAETDRIDEHLFGCASCTAESARVARIVEGFRAAIPAVVSAQQVSELRAQGLIVEENDFAPGERKEATFERHVDVLVHRLGGLDLARAERVQVGIRIVAGDRLVFEDHFAPFDRERGVVRIACQRHFANLPRDVLFDVRAHEPSGAITLTTFAVPHVFLF
jgi:Putative zinc-finger